MELAEIQCKVMPADIKESYPPGMLPEKIAEHIAIDKALFIRGKLEANIHEYTIIAADTIVVLGAEIIGKPISNENAFEILSKLSGNEHKVITGVCMLTETKKIIFSETTYVQFNKLTEPQIVYYVEKFKPYDKAGAYAIQEWIGAVGINSIRGDFYNVMGLPINRIVKEISGMNE